MKESNTNQWNLFLCRCFFCPFLIVCSLAGCNASNNSLIITFSIVPSKWAWKSALLTLSCSGYYFLIIIFSCQAHADELALTFEPVAAATWGTTLNNCVSPVHFGPATDQLLQCLIGIMAPYPPAKVSPSNIWDYYATCNCHCERHGLIWHWLISLMLSFQTLDSLRIDC